MNTLKELRNNILREMYTEAEPGLDFDKVLENPNNQPNNWYKRHYLSNDRQEEIFKKHVQQFKTELTTTEHAGLATTCIINLGPTASKEVAQQARTQS